MSSIYCKKHSLGSLGKCTTPSEGNGIWDAAKKINDKYNIKHVIGSGYFAQVRLAESKEFPGNFYAIKIIDKNKLKGKEDSLEAYNMIQEEINKQLNFGKYLVEL